MNVTQNLPMMRFFRQNIILTLTLAYVLAQVGAISGCGTRQ